MSVLLKARRPRRGADRFFEMGTFLWLPLWSFVCAEAGDILDRVD